MTLPRAGMAAAGLLVVALGVTLAIPPEAARRLDPSSRGSLTIEDRTGVVLRDVPIGDDRSRWVELDELPAWLVDAVVEAEDRRFFLHPGVDPIAAVRATGSNLAAGRIVSGGSTVTMQLIRLLARGPVPRTPAAKAREAVDAIRLTAQCDRTVILEQYLNRAPFGRGKSGVESASLAWFGHSSRTVTPAEATWLAILPRAPRLLSAPEETASLERRRQQLIDRLGRDGRFDSATIALARPAPSVVASESPPFTAPHLTEWLLSALPPALRDRAGRIRSTLDVRLQGDIEQRLKSRLAPLIDKGVRQGAVVVRHNGSGEIRALVGSADFFDPDAGQVNGALARRQAGSTIKPFTYALAFEEGMTPASLVDDTPRPFAAAGGPFVPRNYGGTNFGRVRVRDALAGSLNVAAVDALSRVGVNRLVACLVRTGLIPLESDVSTYGLGLTLGDADVRLVDLVSAYSAFACAGRLRPTALLLEASDARGRSIPLPFAPAPARVFDPVAAWWIGEILSDDAARLRTFSRNGVLDMPWPVSVKTGTSSDWRDNWAIGFCREWTVGVWVGDFSGRPMRQVSGVTGAAPLLRDAFSLLAARGPLTAPDRPPGLEPIVLCVESGEGARKECPGTLIEWMPRDQSAPPDCPIHALSRRRSGETSPRESSIVGPVALRIRSPAPGDHYFFDPALPLESQVVRFRVDAPAGEPVGWQLDDRLLARTRLAHEVDWVLRPGPHSLLVEQGEERARVNFVVTAASGKAPAGK